MREIVADIKRELRAAMNGVASKAMRDAGMTDDYRVNFGVELPRLQALAADIVSQWLPQDEGLERLRATLAQQLWKEAVRECRVLATMIYPPRLMDFELADIWTDTIRTVEIAQIAALNLFSRMPQASSAAFHWIAGEHEMKQLVGFYTILHVVRGGQLAVRSAEELADQAQAALNSPNVRLAQIAAKVLASLEESLDNP